jgi:hypothetical protein
MRVNGGLLYMGNLNETTVRRKRKMTKGRSLVTLQNKIREHKKFYNRVFKNSQKSKEKDSKLPENKRPQKEYFCDRFPTVDSFLRMKPFKQPNITKR